MNERPGLRLAHYILDWAAVTTMIVLIALFALTGDMLPLPAASRHPTGTGYASTYGMRPVLLVLFLAAIAIDALLLLLARYPSVYKYPVEVTGANIEAQYFLAKIMLAIGVCIVNVYFSALMAMIYRMQVHLGDAAFTTLTAVCVSAFGINIGAYLLAAFHNR